MSVLQRSATGVLESLGTRRWGYPPRLMAPVVEQLGAVRALCWFGWNMRRYERTMRAFGSVRTYLLCVAVSVINNCEYCTYAYAGALELSYLHEHDRLFPLSEHAINALWSKPPATIRHCLVKATWRAGLHSDVWCLNRTITLALASDQRPTDTEDIRLCHLVGMFSKLNAIAITSGITPDEAPTPLNKDAALKSRYALLRGYATN